mgnify:CR=1 FL=1
MSSDPKGPTPGSAIKAGCICPVMDNAHGRGYLGSGFVIRDDCKLHGWKERAAFGGPE